MRPLSRGLRIGLSLSFAALCSVILFERTRPPDPPTIIHMLPSEEKAFEKDAAKTAWIERDLTRQDAERKKRQRTTHNYESQLLTTENTKKVDFDQSMEQVEEEIGLPETAVHTDADPDPRTPPQFRFVSDDWTYSNGFNVTFHDGKVAGIGSSSDH